MAHNLRCPLLMTSGCLEASRTSRPDHVEGWRTSLPSPNTSWIYQLTETGIAGGFGGRGKFATGFFTAEKFYGERRTQENDPMNCGGVLLARPHGHLGVWNSRQKAGWEQTSFRRSRSCGIAVLFAFESYCAQFVEISGSQGGERESHRAYAPWTSDAREIRQTSRAK